MPVACLVLSAEFLTPFHQTHLPRSRSHISSSQSDKVSKMQKKTIASVFIPRLNVHSVKSVSVLKRWKDLTPTERHREIVRYCTRHDGRALTLNLSSSFAKNVIVAENPMRQIGKRMNQHLRTADQTALPVMMVLEVTRDTERPHLHGVFVSNGAPISIIQPLMRHAAGYIGGRSGSRQFKANELYNSDGWANYIEKDMRFTRKVLGLAKETRLYWISRAMTQLARDEYEAIRGGHNETANLNAQMTIRAD